jgi:plastocyanin
MQPMFSVLGAAALVALVVSVPSPVTRHLHEPPPLQAATARVMVHCRAGSTPAFATPQQVRIAVGDTVEWRAAGNVVMDSIAISLKDSTQSWPFEGTPARGGTVIRTLAAVAPGTYGYDITVLCRVPGGGVQRQVIDPDIIIAE